MILIGGERTPSDALVGPIATAALKQLHLDPLFLGVHGMDADAGFTTPNLLEAETDRALVAASRTGRLADHTKWGTLGISTIAALDEADEVISDSGLSPQKPGAPLARGSASSGSPVSRRQGALFRGTRTTAGRATWWETSGAGAFSPRPAPTNAAYCCLSRCPNRAAPLW